MTVLFTVPRCSGWLAHWLEFLGSKNVIVRPQQIYLGYRERKYDDVKNEERKLVKKDLNSTIANWEIRLKNKLDG